MPTLEGSTLDLGFAAVTSAEGVHSSGCHLMTKCIDNPYSTRHLPSCVSRSVRPDPPDREDELGGSTDGIALRRGKSTNPSVPLDQTMFFRIVPDPANSRLTDIDEITVKWRSRFAPTAQGFRDRDFEVQYHKIQAKQQSGASSDLTPHPYSFKEAVPDSELPEWYRTPDLGYRTYVGLASELRSCCQAFSEAPAYHDEGANAILTLPSSVKGQAFCMIPRGHCDLVKATFSRYGATPATVTVEAFAHKGCLGPLRQ